MRKQQVKRRPSSRNSGDPSLASPGCRWKRIAVAGLLLLGAACTPHRGDPQPALPAAIEDADDFYNVLRAAGVDVHPTSSLAPPGFGGKGQVVQVGRELIQLYEYDAERDRLKDSQEVAAGRYPSGAPIDPGWKAWATGRLVIAYAGTDGGTQLLLEALLGDPLTRAAEVVDEPYPAAVPAVLAEAAERFALEPTSIEVIGLEEAIWPDTCLGLPRGGETCKTGEVPGWAVRVRGGDQQASYRTDLAGRIVRLDESADGP